MQILKPLNLRNQEENIFFLCTATEMDTPQIPAIFEPLRLRNHCRYRSLQHHIFSPSEKLWIYTNVANKVGINAQQKGRLISTFSKRHSISSDIVKDWITSIDLGETPMASYAVFRKEVDAADGLSCCVDTVGIGAFCDLMSPSSSENSAVTDEAAKDFILKQIEATSERRALATSASNPIPGKRVFVNGVYSGKRVVINGQLSKKIFKK